MDLLITFIILNILNVIIQTVKSIATIKCGKLIAASINAIAYGLYTIVTVYMLCELDLWLKAVIVALCNLVGVYVVKLIEEKARKDKLWKVEATISKAEFETNKELLNLFKVPHNYIDIEKYVILNFYCATSKQSETVKSLLSEMNAKYFVTESKVL
jgi:uncharacterized protein YebE (UPF0316 family)